MKCNLEEIFTFNKKRMSICFLFIFLSVCVGNYSSFSLYTNNAYQIFYNIITDGWLNFFVFSAIIYNTFSLSKSYFNNPQLLVRIKNCSHTLEKAIISSNMLLLVILIILVSASAVFFGGSNFLAIDNIYGTSIFIHIIAKVVFTLILYQLISLLFMYWYIFFGEKKFFYLYGISSIIALMSMFINFTTIQISHWYKFFYIILGLFVEVTYFNLLTEFLCTTICLLFIFSMVLLLKNLVKKKKMIA